MAELGGCAGDSEASAMRRESQPSAGRSSGVQPPDGTEAVLVPHFAATSDGAQPSCSKMGPQGLYSILPNMLVTAYMCNLQALPDPSLQHWRTVAWK